MPLNIFSRDFVVSPVSRHFLYSRDFVVSPVSRHFSYSNRHFTIIRQRGSLITESVFKLENDKILCGAKTGRTGAPKDLSNVQNQKCIFCQMIFNQKLAVASEVSKMMNNVWRLLILNTNPNTQEIAIVKSTLQQCLAKHSQRRQKLNLVYGQTFVIMRCNRQSRISFQRKRRRRLSY